MDFCMVLNWLFNHNMNKKYGISLFSKILNDV